MLKCWCKWNKKLCDLLYSTPNIFSITCINCIDFTYFTRSEFTL